MNTEGATELSRCQCGAVQSEAGITTLGEGGTPLLKVDRLGKLLGLNRLSIKDESVNPTGSFKARGLAMAISRAKELGATKVALPSAGNAGGAGAGGARGRASDSG